LDLAVSETNDHKTFMSQGELGDAFIKSNYYVGVLINNDVS
jgi:hypothetical protein